MDYITNSADDNLTSEKNVKGSEVHFIDIILFVKRYIKLLALIGVGTAFLGIFFSFAMNKKYEANITLLPEYGTSKKGALSLLGAGLSSDGAEKLLPELYPTIMQSSPFGSFLLGQPVVDQENKKYPSLQVFLEATKSKGILSGLFSESSDKTMKKETKLVHEGILSYSLMEQRNIRRALALLSTTIDARNGVVEISAETEDPFVSAILVEAAKNYLVNYVEDYRSSKAVQRVSVLKDRVNEAKKRLKQSEYGLQSYRDRNRSTYSNVAKIEEQRLQAEYLLSQSLYSDLVQRFEQARVSVKEEKPVFKVLEPAKVPLTKSSPNRIRIGLITGVLGVFFGLLYILFVRERIMRRIFDSNS